MTSAVEAVIEAVAAQLPGIEIDPEPRRGEWSHRFAGSLGHRPILVKVPVWPEAPTLDEALAAGPQQDTRDEFVALSAIDSAVKSSGDPGLTSAEPIAYVAEANAIVMVRVDATPLRAYLGRGSGPAEADTVMSRIGRWLSAFAEAMPGSPSEFDGDLAAMEVATTFGGAVPERVIDRASELARSAHGTSVREGPTHGDFSSANVLVTPDGRVAVIDPNRYPGRVTQDPGHLLADLAANSGQLKSLGLLRSSTVLFRWQERIEAGHGALDPRLIRYEYVRSLLTRWADLRQGSSAKRLVGGVVVRRRLRGASDQ